MSFTGKSVPEEFGGRGLGAVPSFLLRVVAAGAATAFVVGVASMAMLFTTAPAWLSLIFEPLSLLLMPGMVISLWHAGPHDLDPMLIMKTSVVMYFVAFLIWFEARAWKWRRNRHSQASVG